MTTQGAEENSEQKPLLLTTSEIGEGTAGRSTNEHSGDTGGIFGMGNTGAKMKHSIEGKVKEIW